MIDGGKQKEKDVESEVPGETEPLVMEKRWQQKMERREERRPGCVISRCACCGRCSEGSRDVGKGPGDQELRANVKNRKKR